MIQLFDFSVNVLRALLWKHNRAEALQSLVYAKAAWYAENQERFWLRWIADVFDLRTANVFGLQVWARILGVRLTLPVGSSGARPVFGFGAFRRNFERAGFGRVGTGAEGLTVEEQRLILRLRYLTLVTRATVPDINRALSIAFADRGRVHVLDPLDMSELVYVFSFTPGQRVLQLLERYDALPRPSAVGVRTVVLARPVFGFGPYNRNFNRGTFGD